MSLRGIFRGLAWTGVGTSVAIVAIGIGGTVAGDYAISNRIHGDTHEKRLKLSEAQAASVTPPGQPVDPALVQGIYNEKTRGFNNASHAHETIRGFSYGALALLVPASAAGLCATRRRPEDTLSPG